MSRDLYAAVAGATATWAQMDVAANNLANVNTTGFRAGRTAFRLIGNGEGVRGKSTPQATEVFNSTREGPIEQDGNPLHFALSGQGYFSLEDGSLTRDGRFTLDDQGRLVTQQGIAVMGEGGPIELSPGESLNASPEGILTGSESGEIDRLKIVDANVEPTGGNRMRATGPTRAATAAVHQGHLEGSNVNSMGVMVELIEAGRHFEAFQKAMQASDDATARLNRIGGS
jgi:flagellar basal-body rod protein FlgF